MHEFAKIHLAAGAPTDAAIFIASDEDIYYCSPRAVEIAGALIQGFGGTECPAPCASEVDPMVGIDPYSGVPFSPELELFHEPEDPDSN